MIKYINEYIKKQMVMLAPYGLFELRILIAFLLAVFSSNKLSCQYIGECFFKNIRIFFNTLRVDDSSTAHLRALVI